MPADGKRKDEELLARSSFEETVYEEDIEALV